MNNIVLSLGFIGISVALDLFAAISGRPGWGQLASWNLMLALAAGLLEIGWRTVAFPALARAVRARSFGGGAALCGGGGGGGWSPFGATALTTRTAQTAPTAPTAAEWVPRLRRRTLRTGLEVSALSLALFSLGARGDASAGDLGARVLAALAFAAGFAALRVPSDEAR